MILPYVNKTQHPDLEDEIFRADPKLTPCTDNVLKNSTCSAQKGNLVTYVSDNYEIKYYSDTKWPTDQIKGAIYFLIVDKSLRNNITNKFYVDCEFIPVLFVDPDFEKDEVPSSL